MSSDNVSYTCGDGRPTLTEMSTTKRCVEQQIRDILTAFNERYGTSVKSIEVYNVDATTVDQPMNAITNVKINLDL